MLGKIAARLYFAYLSSGEYFGGCGLADGIPQCVSSSVYAPHTVQCFILFMENPALLNCFARDI